ncbi:hypothetical protein O181_092323 [Austropuccinia psidii MF-1]|uniref:CCHC-type domain-containing protein n=1 Tax=Austropuccinia psidii MF-1 TaxID=1389203 RepID=A0A9Q3IYB6_9BASI|nr:hypothetical protein [Austropuccinia psidii MF-1]
MEHGQQEVQPSISLSRTWSKLPEDLSQRDRLQGSYGNYQRSESYQAIQTPGGKGKQDKGELSHYPSYRRTVNPDRAYSGSFRLTRSRPNQLSSGFTPLRNQQEERVRPNDPEVVGFGERSAKEPEVVVNNSRISSPINRNTTPTQIQHNAVSPESNLNSDALWLQMCQYDEQTQKQFAELEASNERIEELPASMDKIVKPLQEGHAQLSKASEETNKRLNIFFEEQHHSRRGRDCLYQDINKLFNVYHNMKPQTQGHAMDNQYHPDDIKPDAMFGNKARSPSQYHDGDITLYSEKEALKQLPEASRWPKLCGRGEYDHMELIDHFDGLFIDVPSTPDYWITARLNTAFKGNASILYTEMKEIHGGRVKSSKSTVMVPSYRKRPCHLKITNTLWTKIHMSGELEHSVKFRCNQSCTLDDISNTLQDIRKRTNIGKFTPYESSGFKEKQPLRVEFKDKPKERVAEVSKKKISCHNCGSTDHYANNCPKAKIKVYAIENVSEEESPTEDSESDSMGDAIRGPPDDDQDPREEFLVEYQEEAPLEIQDIQLEAGMPHDTANKNLCKHTQDAQTFLVTPTRGIEYIHGTATKMTVCIDNAQHPLIIDSGAHCSIVARKYLDNHFPNWERQPLPTKAENFKSASGKMTSIGTIIKEMIIPHRKGNIRLNPEFVVLDDAYIQGFFLGTDYQRKYGIDI